MKSNPKPTPDMPLLTFGREHYMTTPHHNSGKLATKQLLYKIERLVAKLTEVLGRIPVVSDLTLDTFERFMAHAAVNDKPKVAEFFGSLLKALLRYAAELELVECPGALLPETAIEFNCTGAADTLWVLAQKQLFPRRVSIGEETQRQYRYAIRDYGRFLGHDPVLADLDDDLFIAWQKHLKALKKSDGQPLSAWTINERIGRLRSLWEFLARKRMVPDFPTVLRLKVAELMPTAFTAEQLRSLFEAAKDMPGRIAGVRARDWWAAFLLFVWSTGERRGASLALRWEWVDFERKLIVIPPHVRKGKQKAGVYQLWPELIVLLNKIKEPKRELVFEWTRSQATYWKDWDKLLALAGIPPGRKSKTQALRVSHASWVKAMGGDATEALMHGDVATTIKHYLDPRMGQRKKRLLFDPRTGASRPVAADEAVIVLDESAVTARQARKLPRAKLLVGKAVSP